MQIFVAESQRAHSHGAAAPHEACIEAGLARAGQPDGGGWVALAGEGATRRAWVKGGRLTTWSGLRHGSRSLLTSRALPRVHELQNLLWLQAAGIPAARPIVAGVGWAPVPLPRLQFLATEEIPEAHPLSSILSSDSEQDSRTRGHALAASGALAARMHMAGFVHRDFFARNLMLGADGTLTILDAWRGGPQGNPGVELCDVVGFLADASADLIAEEGDQFLDAYEREARGSLELPQRAAIKALVASEVNRLAARARRREQRG